MELQVATYTAQMQHINKPDLHASFANVVKTT